MNNLEQLHLDIIKEEYLDSFDEGGHTEMDCEKAASKSAEITEQIAIEFAEWLTRGDSPYTAMYGGNERWLTDDAEFTNKELFYEFLKTKQ